MFSIYVSDLEKTVKNFLMNYFNSLEREEVSASWEGKLDELYLKKKVYSLSIDLIKEILKIDSRDGIIELFKTRSGHYDLILLANKSAVLLCKNDFEDQLKYLEESINEYSKNFSKIFSDSSLVSIINTKIPNDKLWEDSVSAYHKLMNIPVPASPRAYDDFYLSLLYINYFYYYFNVQYEVNGLDTSLKNERKMLNYLSEINEKQDMENVKLFVKDFLDLSMAYFNIKSNNKKENFDALVTYLFNNPEIHEEILLLVEPKYKIYSRYKDKTQIEILKYFDSDILDSETNLLEENLEKICGQFDRKNIKNLMKILEKVDEFDRFEIFSKIADNQELSNISISLIKYGLNYNQLNKFILSDLDLKIIIHSGEQTLYEFVKDNYQKKSQGKALVSLIENIDFIYNSSNQEGLLQLITSYDLADVVVNDYIEYLKNGKKEKADAILSFANSYPDSKKLKLYRAKLASKKDNFSISSRENNMSKDENKTTSLNIIKNKNNENMLKENTSSSINNYAAWFVQYYNDLAKSDGQKLKLEKLVNTYENLDDNLKNRLRKVIIHFPEQLGLFCSDVNNNYGNEGILVILKDNVLFDAYMKNIKDRVIRKKLNTILIGYNNKSHDENKKHMNLVDATCNR